MPQAAHYTTKTYPLSTVIGWCQNKRKREASNWTAENSGISPAAAVSNQTKSLTGDEEGCLLLPDFQREPVWEECEQLDFVASILAGLPLGSMTLAKMDATEAGNLLRVDGIKKNRTPHQTYLVLDGRQRLHAALRAFRTRFTRLERERPNRDDHRIFGIDLAPLAERGAESLCYALIRSSLSVSRTLISKADGLDPTAFDLAARDTHSCLKGVARWLAAPYGSFPRLWVPLTLFSHQTSDGKQLLRHIKNSVAGGQHPHLDQIAAILNRLQRCYESGRVGCTVLTSETSTGSLQIDDYRELQRLVFLQLNTNGKVLTAAQVVAAHLDLRPGIDEIRKRQKAMSSLSYTQYVDLTLGLQGSGHALASSSAEMRQRLDISGLDDELKKEVKARGKAMCGAASAVDQFLETECGVQSGDHVPNTAVLRALCFVTADMLLKAQHEGRSVEASSIERIWEMSDGFFGQGLRPWWFRQCAAQLFGKADSAGLFESLTQDLNDHRVSRFQRFFDEHAAPVTELPRYPMNTKAAKLFGSLLTSLVKKDYRTGADLSQTCCAPQLHHIYPRAWCARQGVPPDQFDSFANLTWIDAYTNRKMLDRSPGEILSACTEFERQCITGNLVQQGLTAEVLRDDNFAEAMRLRGEWLVRQLSLAQGARAAP